MAFNLITNRTAAASPTIILNPRNPAYDQDAISSWFTIAGVDYMRRGAVKRTKNVSKVWIHGEAVVRKHDKKAFYYCYDCEDKKMEQSMLALDGTSSARLHMKNYHNRDPDTGVVGAVKEVAKGAIFTLTEQKNLDTFKALLIRWFVCCQLAFFMLENTVFRELISYLNTTLGALLPKARSTLRTWIVAEYNERKDVLKAELEQSISKIHISFDIWTAGNWIGLISVWAYWIDDAGERQRRLLAFRRIYRSHTGDNQAAIVLQVLEEYNITNRIGHFVCDNASSNDGAVKLILKQLEPTISIEEATARRLRCFSHIINLSARSLLDPTGSEFVIAAEELEIDESTLERAASAWQSTGSLGKLHRLVKYILASPQRREEFSEMKGGRKVVEFDHLGVSRFFSNCARSFY